LSPDVCREENAPYGIDMATLTS